MVLKFNPTSCRTFQRMHTELPFFINKGHTSLGRRSMKCVIFLKMKHVLGVCSINATIKPYFPVQDHSPSVVDMRSTSGCISFCTADLD